MRVRGTGGVGRAVLGSLVESFADESRFSMSMVEGMGGPRAIAEMCWAAQWRLLVMIAGRVSAWRIAGKGLERGQRGSGRFNKAY